MSVLLVVVGDKLAQDAMRLDDDCEEIENSVLLPPLEQHMLVSGIIIIVSLLVLPLKRNTSLPRRA